MSKREIIVRDRKIDLYEAGKGDSILYLHGIADIHGVFAEPAAFHEKLAGACNIIAPAHPGCAGSHEDQTLESIDDLVFHTMEVIDALELDHLSIVGNCIGGWLAAEIAARYPERVERLALIGASGLQISGELIGDLFMAIQPLDGGAGDARDMLFADPDSDLAKTLFADQTTEVTEGLLRYQAFRFAARIGFNPPYFYHPKLRDRLYRFRGDALVVTGEADNFVPATHAAAYADGFPNGELFSVAKAGHAVHLEKPDDIADKIISFLKN